ncbi:MAG: ATP-binding protein [Clostridia bacterium]|nr:ATP-binding protein [Clostridia bacterium]
MNLNLGRLMGSAGKRPKDGRGSLQDLHGVTGCADGCLTAGDRRIRFFRVSPSNLSVLPEEAAESRVRGLGLLLEAEPELEMVCLDAVENLTENRRFLDRRIREEKNERIREVLRKDRAFLEDAGTEGAGIAPSRDFFLLLRLPAEQTSRDGEERARAFAKTADGCGLTVRPAEEQEVSDAFFRYFGLPPESDTAPEPEGTGRRYAGYGDPKPFSDRATPASAQFFPDSYRIGGSFRCVWAVRGYPPSTLEQGLLASLGEREGVTLHIYLRPVSGPERNRLLSGAERRNRFLSASGRLREAVSGEENIKDLTALLSDARLEGGLLLHTAVFLELRSDSEDGLRELKSEVRTELARFRMTADELFLRQKEGFRSVLPGGRNCFGEEFERVLPVLSAANLYPFRYSGKTDPKGLYLGRDKYGSNLFVDTDRRDGDKTNGNVLILGNSGQGKSYLLKLMIINALESGKRVICVDPEGEYRELTEALGGVYADLMEGGNRINPLEIRRWSDTGSLPDGPVDAVSEHIAFLKDFFRVYRDYTDEQTDVIEMLLRDVYRDAFRNANTEAPTLADLYARAEEASGTGTGGKAGSRIRPAAGVGTESGRLIPPDLLREVCLSLRSLCVGAESRWFNGPTALREGPFLTVGLQGIHSCSRRLKDALLFNLFSYVHHRLIADGNTVAVLDELYLFLTNPTVLDYLRSAMKRVRKRSSALWLSSQNVEDFLLPGIREYTAPLFYIPTLRFLFHPGTVSASAFTEALQLEPSAFDRIRDPERGKCLYCCGSERFLLQVRAPDYKRALFGNGGGE